MNEPFHGSCLRLARLYADKTLTDVANTVGVSRQYVHQLETDQTSPSAEMLEAFAVVLGVQKAFFSDFKRSQFGEHQFHFRKLRSTKASTKHRTIAMAEIYRRLVAFLDAQLELPVVNIPQIMVSTASDIEKAAEQARTYWGLGVGPIANMTRVVENAGVPVTFFRGISKEVDALSVSTKRPIIVRNDYKESPGRLRFDIAHELGHLIMHEGRITGDRLTEAEANRFASAFLLPRRTFLSACPVMPRISWSLMKELKAYFKASKACILYRARQLERISEQQYKNAMIRLKKHEGRQERDDHLIGEPEKPELVNNALKAMWEHYGMGLGAIEDELKLRHGNLMGVLGHFKPPANSYSANVVSLKRNVA